MDVEQVRGFFGLDKDEYKEPKFIAAGVLKRAMRELNERADLTFRYEPIKEARKLVGWAFRAIPNTPTITLSAGAAAAKRREEKREEEQIARTSSMPTALFQNARERWLNATQENRERWLSTHVLNYGDVFVRLRQPAFWWRSWPEENGDRGG